MFEFLKKKPKARTSNLPVMREVGLPEVRIMPLEEPGFSQISPENLRRDLFNAASSGDDEKLCCLCKEHEKSIFETGLIWTKVPPEVRANPALLRWYANGLKAIARFCAERLGKPELLEHVKQIESLPEPGDSVPPSEQDQGKQDDGISS